MKGQELMKTGRNVRREKKRVREREKRQYLTYLYCVKLALEKRTGIHPATRESKRDFLVKESPIKNKSPNILLIRTHGAE